MSKSSSSVRTKGLGSGPPAVGTGKTPKEAWLSLTAIGIGIMMVQLDATVVVVANPAIANDLNAGLGSLQWVMTGYLLVLAGLMIPAGHLADKIGRKKALLVGVSGFTLASLLCALAGSIEMLIGARFLQGVFGALLIPASLAVIKAAFPPDKLATALGLFGGVTAIAMSAGPILGGVMVQHLSWQWVFLINLPFGVLSVIMSVIVVRESREKVRHPLDLAGGVTITLSIVGLVWALTNAQEDGWRSFDTLGFVVLSLALLGTFVIIQHRRAHPMVPLSLFRIRSLSVGCLLMVVTMFAFYAVLYYMSFFFQGVQGKNPLAAGVALLPLTLTFIIAAPLGGWVTDKFGVKAALVIGALCCVATSLLLVRLEIDSGLFTVGVPLVLLGLAIGFMMVAATQAIVGSAPQDKAGTASGMQQSLSQLGSVLGAAVFSSVLAALVAGRFGGSLRETFGGNSPLVNQLAGSEEVRQSVELGFPPEAQAGMGEQLANPAQLERLTQAAHDTFISSLHTVFLINAVVAFAAVLLAFLVSNEDTKGDQMAAYR
jgi:EmrB/QacA subfamily drug resistance transporter